MARVGMRSLVVVVACATLACETRQASRGVPIVAHVTLAETAPAFDFALLKVYEDAGGKPGAFLKASPCASVSGLPAGRSGGRHRLELEMPVGGPYFLQFTGHTAADCNNLQAVVAGLAPGAMVREGQGTLIEIAALPVESFAVLDPPNVLDAEIVPRAFHTATVAPDGSLLVAGGAQEVTELPSVACAPGVPRCFRVSRATSGIHRFDPGTGAMILVGALSGRRFMHTATALPGGDPLGKLAVMGGAQSATVGGNGPTGDAPFVRVDATCTNPNDAIGSGCILSSVEVHALDGSAARVFSMTAARAAHASVGLGGGKVLVAGGRTSRIQLGCTTEAQCAAGSICTSDGRCLKNNRDCAQVTNPADGCLPGYTCEAGDGGARCVKRGCRTDEECGGCLASGGCSTGTPSVCDTATGVCTKRGCSQDSECLGSNRRCVQGNCAQVGCDGLSGCPAGKTCDVRTGKCHAADASVDCSAPGGACDCHGDSDCASGFACQTSGEFVGRCRNVQTGCPATVCRRDVNDPNQGPYFDANGQLRRDVNCQGGQCVLHGCLADVDCATGALCQAGVCMSGRRVTDASVSIEVCDLSGGTIGAQVCAERPHLAAAREGAAALCVVPSGAAACDTVVLWGGADRVQDVAEARGANGEAKGNVAAVGCAAVGGCVPSFVAPVVTDTGAFWIGGLGHGNDGALPYQFQSLIWRAGRSAPVAPSLLPAQLPAARALAAAVPWFEGSVLVTGGVGDALATPTTSVVLSAAGDRTSEPQNMGLAHGRFGHTATVLPDGRVVVIGGIAPSVPAALPFVEIFTPRAVLR